MINQTDDVGSQPGAGDAAPNSADAPAWPPRPPGGEESFPEVPRSANGRWVPVPTVGEGDPNTLETTHALARARTRMPEAPSISGATTIEPSGETEAQPGPWNTGPVPTTPSASTAPPVAPAAVQPASAAVPMVPPAAAEVDPAGTAPDLNHDLSTAPYGQPPSADFGDERPAPRFTGAPEVIDDSSGFFERDVRRSRREREFYDFTPGDPATDETVAIRPNGQEPSVESDLDLVDQLRPSESHGFGDEFDDEPIMAGGGLDDLDSRATARRNAIEWAVVLVAAVLLALVLRAFLVQAFFIPSPSMESTLLVDDRVLVNKLSYRLQDLERGDIVVFRRTDEEIAATPDLPADVIKRVIGLPGETIEITNNTVYIDGKELREPYLDEGTYNADFAPVVVPEGHVFVMGDNRAHSQDSRSSTGPIDIDRIVGRAFVLFWPLNRISVL